MKQVNAPRLRAARPKRAMARERTGCSLPPARRPLLPLGTTPTPPPKQPSWADYANPFREARPYVKRCGRGTLGLMFAGEKVAFTALMCGSWSCPSCRRVNAARILDRLRRGMESRADWKRSFATLTIDPSKYGAVPVGWTGWDQNGNRVPLHKAVRRTRLWSSPSPAQFKQACLDMSKEWNRLNDRLGSKARRAETVRPQYCRVVELHRNGWPHYHVVIEHPEWSDEDIEQQFSGWKLGRVDLRPISLDDAVGELAPYLVNTEGKGKAYQFAAMALPVGFRLHSSSREFLADPLPLEREEVLHNVVLPGHFMAHHRYAKSWGADSRILIEPSRPDERYRAPGAALATGRPAVLYYMRQVEMTRSDFLKPGSDSAYECTRKRKKDGLIPAIIMRPPQKQTRPGQPLPFGLTRIATLVDAHPVGEAGAVSAFSHCSGLPPRRGAWPCPTPDNESLLMCYHACGGRYDCRRSAYGRRIRQGAS